MGFNVFDMLCEKMDYNTYYKVNNFCFNTAVGCLGASPFLPLETQVVLFPTEVVCISILFGTDIDKLRDIKEINSIYKEIITDYNKINSDFGLNNPIEVGALFNSCLYDGYFSKDKGFVFGDDNTRELVKISGANVMTGESVCRHIAVLFKDICNDYGMDTATLNIYQPRFKIKLVIDMDRKCPSKEELYRYFDMLFWDEEQNEMIKDKIDSLVKEHGEHILVFMESIEEKRPWFVKSNHRINVISHDGQIYFYCPTNNNVYKLNQANHKFLNSLVDDEISIDLSRFEITNQFTKKDLKRWFSLPSTSFEEDYARIKQTKVLYSENRDVFEKFFIEHQEAYEDISSMMEKIDTKRKVKKK